MEYTLSYDILYCTVHTTPHLTVPILPSHNPYVHILMTCGGDGAVLRAFRYCSASYSKYEYSYSTRTALEYSFLQRSNDLIVPPTRLIYTPTRSRGFLQLTVVANGKSHLMYSTCSRSVIRGGCALLNLAEPISFSFSTVRFRFIRPCINYTCVPVPTIYTVRYGTHIE